MSDISAPQMHTLDIVKGKNLASLFACFSHGSDNQTNF